MPTFSSCRSIRPLTTPPAIFVTTGAAWTTALPTVVAAPVIKPTYLSESPKDLYHSWGRHVAVPASIQDNTNI